VPEPCPKCGAPFVVKKITKAGTRIRCIKEGCDYTIDAETPESGAA
jgi:hypothetical protein